MAINNSVEDILDQLKTIASMVMDASEAEDLQGVLQKIADAARELIGTRYSALGIPDGAGGLQFFVVSGMSEAEIKRIPHQPIGRGLLGMILKNRVSLRLDDMQSHPKSVGFPANHPHMESFLGVPIQVNGTLYGMFYLTDRIDGKSFQQEDQWLIETLAGYAALAISNSQMREQNRQLTLMEERTRIGMALHDGVIQSLYAIGMHLDVAQRTGSLNKEIPEVLESLNVVIEDIRAYIMQLNQKSAPPSMKQCLYEMLSSLHVPKHVRVHVDAPEEQPPFIPAVFESICMMANEAISNALRHADAHNIYAKMYHDNENLTISISDDGRGFDMMHVIGNGHGGLGLKNLRQRASLYRGSVSIDSDPGSGTTIQIVIPLRQN